MRENRRKRRRRSCLQARSLAFLLSMLAAAGNVSAQVLERFPFVLHAAQSDALDPLPGVTLLPDRPFSAEAGYGHVGGRAVVLQDTLTLGGEPSWPVSWREGMERYSFRVPRGEYLVELTLIETQVASPSLRVFDVLAEGEELFPQVDVYAVAGDFAWVTLKGLVSVYDGWLDLRFVSATPELPACVARIRVAEGGAGIPQALELSKAPRLRAEAGPESVTLTWQGPDLPGVVGYGIFRSATRSGLYHSLTAKPVSVPWYEDTAVRAGQRYVYKVRAFGVRGGQSEFSAVVEAVPTPVQDLGLKVYDLRVSPTELASLGARGSRESPRDARVPARFDFRGKAYSVFLYVESGRAQWQRKKSYRIELDRTQNRYFARRSSLYLSAEANDPTFLREVLTSTVADRLGVPSPVVEPVVLLINGHYQGLYFDIEEVDREFLRREGLDRFGLLSSLTGGDGFRRNWVPPGDKIGKNGAIIELNRFVHELETLADGEVDAFFRRHLYLERFLRWRAFAAVRGESQAPLRGLRLLRDSRNARWQYVRPFHRSGDWGIGLMPMSSRECSVEEARKILLDGSVQGGSYPAEGPWVLFSRLLHAPALRALYLDEVELLLQEVLTPETFDSFVDEQHGTILAAAAVDPLTMLSPARHRVLMDSKAELKVAYRKRREALLRVSPLLRAETVSPLRFNEISVQDASGNPVQAASVELQNVSAQVVDLRRFGFSHDLRKPLLAPLPARTLEPGGLVSIEIPVRASRNLRAAGQSTPFSVSLAGGSLILHARSDDENAAPEFVDMVFYGRIKVGLSYARLDERWEYSREPTPAAPNRGATVAAPTYEFRHGVLRSRRGDFTIWVRPDRSDPDGVALTDVHMYYRGARADTFSRVPLVWNDEAFRYQVGLEGDSKRGKVAYYFVATNEAGLERAYPLPAPDLLLYLPDLPELKINEVMPRPSLEEPEMGEFIEIYNPSSSAVDIGGYFLTDKRSNPTKWRVPDGQVIMPGAFIVFWTGDVASGVRTNFRLKNSGEYVGLFGRLEEGNLEVDGMSFRGMRPGESWGRTRDGGPGFRVWKDPTPGARNLPKIPKEFLREGRKNSSSGRGNADNSR